MDLNTRQHIRASLDVPLRFQVQLNHRSQVDLVGTEAARAARTNDISEGGLSFSCRVFLPRGTLLDMDLEIADGVSAPPGLDGQTLTGRVQRCTMVGRQPNYLMAMAFVDVDPAVQMQISQYVEDWEPELAPSEPAPAEAAV